MRAEIEQLLDSTTPHSVRPLDVSNLVKRSRRQRVARRLGLVVVILALVGGATQVAVTADLFRSGPRTLDPAGGGTEGADVGPIIEELQEANRALPAAPPRAGHALASQGVSVALSGDSLQIFEWKSSLTGRGDSHRAVVTIRSGVPVGTTAEELRAMVEEAMGEGGAANETPTDFPNATKMVEKADKLAEELGAEDRALALLEEALPVAFDPSDRIMALEVLGSLDSHLVYRGDVTTLQGNAGVGIAWFDPEARSWHTLIFDRDTGLYLGSMVESPWPDDEHLAITSFETILGSELVVDDGERGG